MLNGEGWLVGIQSLLTRIFIRYLKRSEFEGKENVPLDGETITVYTFYKEGDIFAQATPFGTIIFNKTNTGRLSTDAKRLVLLHEQSHRNRNSIYKGLFLGTIVAFAAGCWILLFSIFYVILGVPVARVGKWVFIALCMIGVFVVLFRIEETWADYDALSDLGEEKFLSAYDEINSEGPSSLHSKIVGMLLYTRPERTVRLYRRLQNLHLIY